MILEESLAGSALVQIVLHRLQILGICRNSVGVLAEESGSCCRLTQIRPLLGVRTLKRTAVEDALAGWGTRKKNQGKNLSEKL